MARTKASVGAKVASSKSSKARCSVAPTTSSHGGAGSSDRASRSHSGGGNSVCHRETPKWQKPITTFFIQKDENKEKNSSKEDIDVDDNIKTNGELYNGEGASSSKSKRKNVIESDSEDENLTEKPKNTVLDETIELEPLNGEDSHKIEEYYTKGAKGKGVGKKTKGKENRRDSKRGREDEDSASVSKKVKVN